MPDAATDAQWLRDEYPALSLWRRVAWLCAPSLAAATLIYVGIMASTTTQPEIINLLMRWLLESNPDFRVGALYVIAVAGASYIGTVSSQFFDLATFKIGARVRDAVSILAFEKLLRLRRVDASTKASPAALLSLTTIDAVALEDFFNGLICTILVPVESELCLQAKQYFMIKHVYTIDAVAILLGLLWMLMTWAMLAGIGALGVTLAAGFIASRHLQWLTEERGGVTSARGRLVFELLASSLAVKLRAWEPFFEARILQRRAAESRVSRRIGCMQAVEILFLKSSASFVSAAVAMVWTLGMNKPLDITIFTFGVTMFIFTTRALKLPAAVVQFRNGATALANLDAFLALPEPPDTRVFMDGDSQVLISCDGTEQDRTSRGAARVHPPPGLGDVCIEGGSFSWRPAASTAEVSSGQDLQPEETAAGLPPLPGTDPTFILSSVDLTLHQGQLAVIVGAAASGKSTLLQSLLGETTQLAGKVSLGTCRSAAAGVGGAFASITDSEDPLAYVPQVPWVIAEATIAENIVMGRLLDEQRLEDCIRTTSLSKDLETMPHGLHTVVSGGTLSGGQKMRISLARAAYSRAPIVLIDDCFSALDPVVADYVFKECVMGLMSKRTRIVVTRLPAAISKCDVLGLLLPASELQALSFSWDEMRFDSQRVERKSESDGRIHSGAASCSHAAYTLLAAPRGDFARHSIAPILVDNCLGYAAPLTDPPISSDFEVGTKSAPTSNSPHVPTDNPKPVCVPPFEPPLPAAVPAHQLLPGAGLPILTSWFLGIGGSSPAATYLSLLIANTIVFLASNYFLAIWVGDPQYKLLGALWKYIVIYAVLALLDFFLSFARFVLQDVGSVAAADRLHGALLHRLVHAPQVFIDRTPRSRILDWLTVQLKCIDLETNLVSEYFWYYSVLAIKNILSPLVFTPWILVPAGILVGSITAILLLDDPVMNQQYELKAADSVTATSAGHSPNVNMRCSNEDARGHVSPTSRLRRHLSSGRLMQTLTSWTESRREPHRLHKQRSTFICLPLKRDTLCGSCRDAEGVPSYVDVIADRVATRSALDTHVAVCAEGTASLRAFGMCERAVVTHRFLLESYDAAASGARMHIWRRDFFVLLLASTFFVACAALVVPLRLAHLSNAAAHLQAHYGSGIKSNEAAFILFSGCMVAAQATICLQRLEDMRALARARGALIWAQRNIPQDASAVDTAEAAQRTSEIDAEYATAISAMAVFNDASLQPNQRLDLELPVSSYRHAQHVSRDWPSSGYLVVRGLELRYDRGGSVGPLMLRGVSLDVRPGQWVSIVGRTGAGKSSLLAGILRLVEPCGGKVEIDGVDVATVPLRVLRHRVAVISQDPLFISGTLRQNLDPFSMHSNSALLSALRRVGWFDNTAANRRQGAMTAPACMSSPMADAAAADSSALSDKEGSDLAPLISRSAHPSDLGLRLPHVLVCADESPLGDLIAERGVNLSAGQQQLIAVARALLDSPRILLLDEAYASLGSDETSTLHRVVRDAFSSCAVLQVSHTLSTVIDSDLVIVLDDGAIVEQGAPNDLLHPTRNQPVSRFQSMVPEHQRAALYEAAERAAASREAVPRRRVRWDLPPRDSDTE